MRGKLADVAKFLGCEEREAYTRARDASDPAVRQIKRGTYEADDSAAGSGFTRGRRGGASTPSPASEPVRAPITRVGFSVVLDMEAEIATLKSLGLTANQAADNCVAAVRLHQTGIRETGRRHTAILPRRGWTDKEEA